MPHLTLEYSDNLPQFDIDGMLLDLNKTLVASGYFDEIDIKSRAVRLGTFLVGTEVEGRGFVHVKLALLSGRSTEAKRALSESLLRVLEHAQEPTDGVHVQLCVEIQEIDRETYVKASIAP
ncbi:5-carboxymethyl-2-hydroxymuconate Delta-isomerase [Trinickia dinghuensis]|uniref:5-carboxymethyl-2-hydroxymuconate Delta-isomerase n=1 Tax=Trinickia dinghuensis TaxID=2291023 RepID=A0A3D8JTU2_9BURK|nr:5-carboxymethyl-2-hydroxymuconate Delta-isomerase [Trinickia dinghuensis]RDU96519.1 5-carboxymethyl-2-hydroxymuconate Delta-isomerase [Trinickia dinghuensis]